MWEPWASLMAISAKRIETRGWASAYRGPLAIHACKGGLCQRDLLRTCYNEPFQKVLRAVIPAEEVKYGFDFPRGHIIAVCNLVDCRATTVGVHLPGWSGAVFNAYPELDTPQERAFGNYEHGRYGLVTSGMFRLPQPIPFKSRQGKLLDLPAEIAAEVNRQWKAAA